MGDNTEEPLEKIREHILRNRRDQTSLNLDKIRLIFSSLYICGVTLNLASYRSQQHLIFAYSIGIFYLILISLIARYSKKNKSSNSHFEYLALLIDYIVFMGVIALRGIFQTEVMTDIFLYCLKNPMFYTLYVLLLLPLVYLDKTLILYSGTIFSIILIALFTGLIIYSPNSLTRQWEEHALGSKISPTLIAIKGFLGISLSTISYFSIQLLDHLVNLISTTESQKNKLKQYFSPTLVDKLIHSSTSNLLEMGVRLELVILFIDIRNFTDLSEKLSPEELTKFLSNFRSIAIKKIFKYEGAVDKFIGDAILAVFGVPIAKAARDPKKICYNAAQASIEIYNTLQKESQTNINLHNCQVKMGIHIGETFIGNIKSHTQLEYTVIGKSVNVASRLEGLCKRLNVSCIISEAVYEQIKKEIPTQKAYKNVSIRGIQESMNIYVLI